MRSFLYVAALGLVCLVAVWAYQVINVTQELVDDVERLHDRIATEQEGIAVLHAEWAWLNRPERLDRLVDAHQDVLGLAPMSPDHFAEIAAVAFQPPPPRLPGPAPAPAATPIAAVLLAAAPQGVTPAEASRAPMAEPVPPAVPELAAAEKQVTLTDLAGRDAIALGLTPPPPRPPLPARAEQVAALSPTR